MDEAQKESVRVEDVAREPATRVKRTYGRKKEATDAPTDASSHTILSYRTRLDSADESEALGYLRSSKNLIGDASNAFGWKERLALIDKQFNDEETQVANKSTAGTADIHTVRDSSSTKSVSTEDDSFGVYDDALLSGSNPPLTSSQSDPPSPGLADTKCVKTRTSSSDADKSEDKRSTQAETLDPVSPRGHSTDPSRTLTTVAPSSDDEWALRTKTKRASTTIPMNNGLFDEHKEVERYPKNVQKGSSEKLKERANKIKKLSKKEEKESKKAHARIMADHKVSITKRAQHYTVELLLKSVQQNQLLAEAKPPVVSSDPIQEFTSSPMLNAANTSAELGPKAGPSGLHDTSEDELPDKHELFKRKAEKQHREQADVKRKKSLALAKQRALESLETQVAQSDSDDDDLVVVEAADEVISKRTRASTAYEKRLAGVAGFRAGVGRHALSGVLEGSQGERALKMAAESTFTDRHTRRTKTAVDHRDLQTAMLSKASKQSMQITKEKEEEWKRRGGRLADKQRAALSTKPLSLGHLAGELALKKQRDEQSDLQDDTAGAGSGLEDSDDEDWRFQEHGSASPLSRQSGRDSDNGEGELGGSAGELGGGDAHGDGIFTMQQQIDTEEDEDSGQRPRQFRRSTNLLVLSDSEGEEPHTRQATGRVLVPDTSMIIDDRGHGGIISSESGADEENKENDTPQPFDSGDDKENAMVVSQGLTSGPRGLGSRQPSRIFDLEDRARLLSMSPTADAETDDGRSTRRPLQSRKMGKLDDPFMLRSPASVVSFSTPKSNRVLSAATSPISLQPAFGGGAGGFSQLFNDDEGVVPVDMDASSIGLLQPAFRLQEGDDENDSPLRSSFAAKPMKVGSPSNTFSPESVKANFMNRPQRSEKVDELSLTLDTRLQPALDVTTQIRRKADAVFEKEQDFVVEEASTSPTSSRSRQELYVSENGLLTQTRPESSTPLMYRSSTPSQRSAPIASRAPPSTTQRLPLSTLSLAADAVSPSQRRLTRLVKGKSRTGSSNEGNLLASTSPTGHPPSAFTKLLEGAKRQDKKDKKKLGKSHFVEGEAEESDEDELFGFGGPKAKEDEDDSDDDDPDAVVENLVDDATMDAQQLAEDKVLEKVKEQLEEEDAALQKYHQAAVEGKYRSKRRGGGIAMDDSESDEDEDEEARRLRRRMHKKRRIQGDKLEDLAKDVKSRVFYEAYQRDIQEEDNEDFAHLASDVMDIEDENEEPETVSTTEIQEQLREAARQQKGKERHLHTFDPEDVERTHSLGTSDDEFEVKEVDDRPKKTVPRRPVFGQLDIPEFDDSAPRRPHKMSDEQAAQLAAWRKEQSGRNLGTGGMRGAITGTGHGSKAASRAESMSRVASGRPRGVEQPVHRKMTKTASVLASVSDKHSRFAL